jgi:hypothetical protein
MKTYNALDVSYIESRFARKEEKYLRFVKSQRAKRKERYVKLTTRKAVRGY